MARGRHGATERIQTRPAAPGQGCQLLPLLRLVRVARWLFFQSVVPDAAATTCKVARYCTPPRFARSFRIQSGLPDRCFLVEVATCCSFQPNLPGATLGQCCQIILLPTNRAATSLLKIKFRLMSSDCIYISFTLWIVCNPHPPLVNQFEFQL